MQYFNNNNSFCFADMKLLHFNINEYLQEIKIKKARKSFFNCQEADQYIFLLLKSLAIQWEAGESKLKADITILNSF